MTHNKLLDDLHAFTVDAVKDLILPVALQEQDTEQNYRAADVYKMRLPDSSSAKKKAPYIIHQVVTSQTVQKPGEAIPTMRTVIRSVFAVYSRDEQEGALHLLNLMDRLQIAIERQVVIGQQFKLDLDAGVETMIYPDNLAPYFVGEMSTTWISRAVRREVSTWP